jgi:hypothetical protein
MRSTIEIMPIIETLRNLLRDSAGLPQLRYDGSGRFEGWPSEHVGQVRRVISAIARSSKDDLAGVVKEIESADRMRVPEGLLILLARAAWDAPNAPDITDIARSREKKFP